MDVRILGHVAVLAVIALPLIACSDDAALSRQIYFDTASSARVAWQPEPNQPTSFLGCGWGSASYPCQPHSKLDSPAAAIRASSLTHKDAVKVHKPIHHKHASSHANAHQPLPLCQPVTSSPRATPTAVATSAANQANSNPIAINPRSSS